MILRAAKKESSSASGTETDEFARGVDDNSGRMRLGDSYHIVTNDSESRMVIERTADVFGRNARGARPERMAA